MAYRYDERQQHEIAKLLHQKEQINKKLKYFEDQLDEKNPYKKGQKIRIVGNNRYSSNKKTEVIGYVEYSGFRSDLNEFTFRLWQVKKDGTQSQRRRGSTK